MFLFIFQISLLKEKQQIWQLRPSRRCNPNQNKKTAGNPAM